MFVRDFDKTADMNHLRDCLVELQDFERRLDPRMPPGTDIVDAYIPHMLNRCKQCSGKVLVAEVDGDVAGYATILTRVNSEELEDGDYEYGLVSDLVILEKYRKLGLGKRLLEEAETYARSCEVKWLRIGVLAGNPTAENLYSSMGFSSKYIELEKELAKSQSGG